MLNAEAEMIRRACPSCSGYFYLDSGVARCPHCSKTVKAEKRRLPSSMEAATRSGYVFVGARRAGTKESTATSKPYRTVKPNSKNDDSALKDKQGFWRDQLEAICEEFGLGSLGGDLTQLAKKFGIKERTNEQQ